MDYVRHIPLAVDLRGRKVLVADPDRTTRPALDAILDPSGYVLADADSASRTLTVYAEFQPDLVLIELMSGLDGFATYRTLKKTHGAQCSPVIFLTASSPADDVVEGLDALGFDYVLKPFNPPEVLARIHSQLQNRHLVAQQRIMVEELDKANKEKNRLLTTAAKNLRDPLASIDLLTGFLRDGSVGTLTPDQLDLVDTIHNASGSLLTMVNDLLDVTAIEANTIKLELKYTDFADLITKCVYVANMDAAKKNTKVAFQRTGPANPVKLDPDKMKQVIDNLLSNAVKYSPPGSTIAADLRMEFTGAWRFSVKDQGPGIPPGERHKLFQEFGRLSVQPTAGEKSTGLGLAICRRIVEAHAGSIGADNLPDRGAEFHVTFSPRK